jgi:hypothetical protein
MSIEFEAFVQSSIESIKRQMANRGYRAANTLRNKAVNEVLRGQRHGRKYIVPGTGRMHYNKRKHTARITYKYYTASAPGEPPAVRTGEFRLSWLPEVDITANGNYSVTSKIESGIKVGKNGYLLGDILEEGTSRMAPRPYKEKVQDKALNEIVNIYSEPYT